MGTASTGVAISSLTGAAATSAALAALGGGALTAGGLGVAGGTALLGLFTPIAAAAGGSILIGTALKDHDRKQELQSDLPAAIRELKRRSKEFARANKNATKLLIPTTNNVNGIEAKLRVLSFRAPKDYKQYNWTQKSEHSTLVNHMRSLSDLMTKTVL